MLWGVVASSWVVHQSRYSSSLTPFDVGIRTWEPLRLLTEDRVPIAGWLIRSPDPQGILVLLHGFGTAKADLLDMAEAFHRAGRYHLILIDFRAHGDSGGSVLSFGKQEVLDVKAVLSYAESEPSLKGLPVGCYGISMGGAIGILAAARYPEIRFVVSDSAYADLGKAIARALRISYYIPRLLLGQTVIWMTQLRLGAAATTLSPARAVSKVSPRPVMVIHGTCDRTTPSEDAQEIYSAAGEPKQLWLIQDAEHVCGFYRDREGYVRRVMEFFSYGFLGKT